MKLINEVSFEKLRGGFYTPNSIASFILRWGFNGSNDYDVLEPSCGDGVFLEEIKKCDYKYKSINAIEIDPIEAKKADDLNLPRTKVEISDFHEFCLNTEKKFNLIIGNPPYIRYQFFNKEQQKAAEKIFQRANLKYSKLTNAWVSFLIGSSFLLKGNGKIGFVLPAELLQVSYARQLRDYLSHFYNKINIISFQELVFPKIQQEVILLLCEKNDSSLHLIEHIELKDAQELKKLNVSILKSPKKRIDLKSNKWTFYFLNQEEIDFIENLKENNVIPKIANFANVEVGITTGSNNFFTVSYSTIEKYDLEKYAYPLVGRSVQIPSVIFTKKDWLKNRTNGARTHLLVFPSINNLMNDNGAMEYIKWGEKQEINKGYKCRIRNEWQMIPSLRTSEALFIRRNYLYPKLIINNINAYTTDTMHRVSMKPGVDIDAVVASYYNSISLAFTEICGRSHGGGVLELMPSEVEDVLLPYNENNSELLEMIDIMIREKRDIDEILAVTNQKILKENYGLSSKDIKIANGIWKKLSSRRLKRGRVKN